MRTKTLNIQNEIMKNDYDIIVLTETYLNPSIYDYEFIDSRYIVYRRDRLTTGINPEMDGGGVLIAISKKIQSSPHACNYGRASVKTYGQ